MEIKCDFDSAERICSSGFRPCTASDVILLRLHRAFGAVSQEGHWKAEDLCATAENFSPVVEDKLGAEVPGGDNCGNGTELGDRHSSSLPCGALTRNTWS